MQRSFKSWCERQAIYWRKRLELPAHACLPARELANEFRTDVIKPEDIPGMAQKDLDHLLRLDSKSWSAVTLSADECTLIIYNALHSLARQEADIMHELAHIIRGHRPTGLKYTRGFPFPLREYKKEDEEEAQWLGGCLQIPREGLKWALNYGMTEDQIANYFVASLDMVRYRRNITGIDIQRIHARR
jgi:Zn-dependent peptidase ImmA (M78 family)